MHVHALGLETRDTLLRFFTGRAGAPEQYQLTRAHCSQPLGAAQTKAAQTAGDQIAARRVDRQCFLISR